MTNMDPRGHSEFKALERAFTPSDTGRKQFFNNAVTTVAWHMRATVFCIQLKYHHQNIKVGCKEKQSMLVWGLLLLSSNDYRSRLLRFFFNTLKV